MASKGSQNLAADNLIVTTGSQQALDLLGKTMISPGDKVIVEGPTFLATIQCFRLYGAHLITHPLTPTVYGRQTGSPDCRAQAQTRVPGSTFGNPAGPC